MSLILDTDDPAIEWPLIAYESGLPLVIPAPAGLIDLYEDTWWDEVDFCLDAAGHVINLEIVPAPGSREQVIERVIFTVSDRRVDVRRFVDLALIRSVPTGRRGWRGRRGRTRSASPREAADIFDLSDAEAWRLMADRFGVRLTP
ncbi:hypothetical protein [Mycetocola saprophilus]|uniref:hypothetical protein n=1 Tax=Mycetocola saprophilus TaxID=76636 RepID=UPI0004BF8295|nr:hypothetical protein [Mycetocola saprophilus]